MPKIFYYLTITITSLRFSEVYFSHFTSQVRLFFVEKRDPKIFGLKTAMDREMRKCLTFVIRQITSKENNTEALVILKRLKFPQDDRTGSNFIAPLRMHF